MTTMNVLDSVGATVAIEKPLAPGSAADAASRPVALSTEAKASIGALTETAPATDTASSGLNGRLQRIAQRLTTLIAGSPASLGALADSGSLSTAWSTETKAQVGIITETAPATDIASSGLNGRLQRIAQRLTTAIALLPAALGAGGGLKVQMYNAAGSNVDPLPPGSAADAASVPVAQSTEGKAQIGSLTETAPASDTASSGLNGRLQRIAQRLTSTQPLLVAHGATDSAEPTKVGFKATTSLSALTLVTNAQRTDGYAGVDGVQIQRPHCNLEDIVSGNASDTAGTSTSVIATAGAGIKQYLTRVIITNMHATTVAYVQMKSGTTVKATIPCPPGGATVDFNPPLPPNAANEAWNFHPSAAVTTIYCTAVGFKSKV